MTDPLEKRLVEKSIEAFILGVEIYNKPTIKYRVEGFSFFICNAWELMLKAHLIKTKGEASIYYKDNKDRTLSLENCIRIIFTNDKSPLRLNLEKIIELRNTSTHFITEEYEMLYVPLFQACVLNFSDKIYEFHEFDITTVIPQNFLTLNISMKAIKNTSIIAKYPEEISNKLIGRKAEIDEINEVANPEFSIKIEHHHYLVRDKSKATSFVKLDSGANSKVKILKDIKDPNNTHPYNMKKLIEEIKKQLKRNDIDIELNQYVCLLFVNYYRFKGDERYCFEYKSGERSLYTYSRQAIDFIVEEIKKDPDNIVNNLKKKIKK